MTLPIACCQASLNSRILESPKKSVTPATAAAAAVMRPAPNNQTAASTARSADRQWPHVTNPRAFGKKAGSRIAQHKGGEPHRARGPERQGAEMRQKF